MVNSIESFSKVILIFLLNILEYQGCFIKTSSSSSQFSNPILDEEFTFQSTCGISSIEGNVYGKSLNNRIINGDNARSDFFPWMVSLIISIDNKWYHNCGGTLISNQHVLTSAHCVIGRSNDLKVIVGAYDFTNPLKQENVFDLINIIINPGYSGNDNDIAILKLSKPINQDFYPICLPPSDKAEVIFDKKVVTAGWGVTDGNYYGSPSQKLLKAELNVINGQSICLNYRNFYCLLDNSFKKSNICYGDSGGPLMFFSNGNWYLFGVACCATADVDKKCSNTFPSYFTMVPKYVNWIRQVINSV